jgi:hypothetical protein
MLLSVTLISCGPTGAPGETPFTDAQEKLGVPVFQSSSAFIGKNGVAMDSKGRIHVLFAAISPPTSKAAKGSSKLIYRRIEADGKITEKSAPETGVANTGPTNLLVTTDTDEPVLIEQFVTAVSGFNSMPIVEFLTIHVSDGDRFHAIPFTQKDGFRLLQYSHGFLMTPRKANTTRVLPLKHNDVLLQFEGQLFRFDGTSWSRLERPTDATAMAVVAADATRVRVVWLSTDGKLKTDVYLRSTWKLSGTAVSMVGHGLAEIETPGANGTVDTFGFQGLRFSKNKFRKAGESPGTVFRTTHKYRQVSGVISENSVELRGTYLGKSTTPNGADPLGTVIVNNQIETNVRALSFNIMPNADGIVQILVSNAAPSAPDASIAVSLGTSRVYVKRTQFVLPGNVGVEGTGKFPGDDGSVDDGDTTPDNLLRVSGRAFVPDSTMHAGITVTLNSGFNLVATAMTAVDGTFELQPVMPGDYTLKMTFVGPGRDFENSVKLAMGSVGSINVEAILYSRLALAYKFGILPGAPLNPSEIWMTQNTPWMRAQNKLWHQTLVNGQGDVWSMASSDPGAVPLPEGLWLEGCPSACIAKSSSGVVGPAAPLNRLRIGGGYIWVSNGVIDGVTPRTFSDVRNGTVASGFVDIAPYGINGTYVGFKTGTDGGYTAQESTGQPAFAVPSIYSLDDTAVANWGLYIGGKNCGARSTSPQACDAYFKTGQLMDTQVIESDGQIWVKKLGATTGEVKTRNTGSCGTITLPSNTGPHNWLIESGSRVRAADGLYACNGTALVKQHDNVVRLEGKVFWKAPMGKSDCSAGCELYAPNKIEGYVANGNEQVVQIQGRSVSILGTGAGGVCPWGSCTLVKLIELTSTTSTVSTIGAGRFLVDVLASPTGFGRLHDSSWVAFEPMRITQ